MLDMKKLLTKILTRYTTDTFYNSAITITAGTAGTYATYQTIDVAKTGYTPIGIINYTVSHGGSYHPLIFKNGTTVYINCYRAITGAYSVPAKDISVTVLYEKT